MQKNVIFEVFNSKVQNILNKSFCISLFFSNLSEGSGIPSQEIDQAFKSSFKFIKYYFYTGFDDPKVNPHNLKMGCYYYYLS